MGFSFLTFVVEIHRIDCMVSYSGVICYISLVE